MVLIEDCIASKELFIIYARRAYITYVNINIVRLIVTWNVAWTRSPLPCRRAARNASIVASKHWVLRDSVHSFTSVSELHNSTAPWMLSQPVAA